MLSQEIASRYKNDKTAIIQMLNAIQDHYGYLPKDEIISLSKSIMLPMSKIWGIITFYSHYKLTRPAKHPVRVCSGTACHVKNSKLLKDVFEELIEDLPEDEVSVESVACLGCCALAPVFEVNGEVHGGMTKKKVEELASELHGEEMR